MTYPFVPIQKFPFQQISKDPAAILDYVVDWTSWLAPVSDAISSVVWIVPTPGPTITAQLNSANTATVWLAGGTLGKLYTITCRITTVAGRTEDRSFNLYMEQH